MSKGAKKHWPHPLLPWLTAAAAASDPPLLPYAPMAEFRRQLEHVAIPHPLIIEDEAKKHILATYHHSMAAVFAIAAGGGSDLHGDELHALIYRASDDPFVFAFIEAAAAALCMGRHPAFTVSTRLPGFMDALEAWARHFEYDKRFHGPERLKYVNRELIRKNVTGAEFWLRACERDFPSPADYMRAVTKEVGLADDAERNTAKRKPRSAPRFKDSIAYGWLPASLWARGNADIAYLIDPTGPAGVDRVKRDISALKFTASHRSAWRDFIDKAELEAKKVSNSQDS